MNTDHRFPAKAWSIEYSVGAVPEPGIVSLCLVGLRGLSGWIFKKRRLGVFLALALEMIALGSQARAASLAYDTGANYTNSWNAAKGGTQPAGPFAVGQIGVTQAVPEPSKLGLLGVGLVSLLGFFRLKRPCV
jgi:hypothetical protein